MDREYSRKLFGLCFTLLLYIGTAQTQLPPGRQLPGSNMRPNAPGSNMRPNAPGSNMRPNAPGSNMRPNGPGSNIRPNVPRAGSNPNTGGTSVSVSCSAAGRSAISKCFQANGGIQMQFVVALISNGTQGPLPSNTEQLRAAVCGPQGKIIACIFSGISSLRGTSQCRSMSEYIRLEQDTVGLVTGMQQACGNGPLPPPSSCHQDLDKDLKKCYQLAGLDPALFAAADPTAVRNGSFSKIIGGVIGGDIKTARHFCSVKTRLFSCMKQTIDKCQGAIELISLSGYDHDSLQKAIDVLCHDVNLYTEGLQCFQTPSIAVKRCYNIMADQTTNLTAEQLRTSMPLNQYHNRFCQLMISHMDCNLRAWERTCEEKYIGLKNEFECNLLPTRCKNDPTLENKLQQTCSISKYRRQLRSGASKLSSVSVIMTVVTFMVVLFL